MRRFFLGLALLLPVVPAVAHAQAKRWTRIGTTSTGNPVFIDRRTVKKTGALVSAIVRVEFVTPVQTPKGAWTSGRVTGTYDCAKRSVAAKEQVYYGDKAERKVLEHKVNKIPGFGPALGGSLPAVVLDYLCTAGK